MTATPPPSLPEKPELLVIYNCIQSHQATNPNDISFEEGDILWASKDQKSEKFLIVKLKGIEYTIPRTMINTYIEEMPSIFHEAAKRGDMGLVDKCINYKIPINSRDASGSTPLHWAAEYGQDECVATLLDCPGIQLNIKNKLGDTPLHNACWKNNSKVVKLLVDAHVDTKVLNRDGKTPVELAKDAHTIVLLKKRFSVFDDEKYFSPKEKATAEEK